jgi:hypothetical protein
MVPKVHPSYGSSRVDQQSTPLRKVTSGVCKSTANTMTHKQHDSPEGMIQQEDVAIRVLRVLLFAVILFVGCGVRLQLYFESEYSW